MVKIGLALGGGGAKGIAHIKFLKVFDELKIKPSAISGTSIGAIIGSLYSAGMSAIEIEKYFLSMDLKKVMKLLDISWSTKTGLFGGKKIRKEYEQLIKLKDFKDLKIPLYVVAADFWKQEELIFSKGNIADAVRASGSIPGVFDPVTVGGRVLVDGGIINPLPFELLKKKCGVVIAIDVMSDNHKKRGHVRSPTILEQVLKSLEIMQTSIIKTKLQHSKPDLYLNPRMGNIEVLDFHKARQIIHSEDSEVQKLRKYLKKLMKSSTFWSKI